LFFFEESTQKHEHYTRHKNLLIPPQTRLTMIQENVYSHTIKIYNHLPNYIKQIENSQFKRELKVFLISKAFYTIEEYFSE